MDFLQHPFRFDVPHHRTRRFYRGEQNVHGSPLLQKLRLSDGAHPETVRVPGFSSLKRNDVIVFNFPTHTNGRWDMDLGTFYVKRCIALPGDTLSIIAGINHINGQTGYGNMEEQQRLHHYCGEYAPNLQRFPLRLLASLEHPRLRSPVPSRRGNHYHH